ncbi:MAG: efflux RND transporter permease subunit, partial [Gammaproteobacteria bacterium]|nr:efflux RND transporter permease subunit [Gammaproteobacteria bacterium]
RLRAYGIPLGHLTQAIRAANQEVGGSVLELAEAEYMVRSRGYITSVADIETIPIDVGPDGTPILLRDLARVEIGPEMRRAVAELDGEGEVSGGIVVMRQGENALATIAAVKAKLEELKPGLPAGVEILTTYDRAPLILDAVSNLRDKLIEELIVVALVCLVFLFHLRSALVAVVSLPLGILVAFILMRHQGINANILSLGGIAIAIGAMVDAAVVMIENAHKHLERYRQAHGGAVPRGQAHWDLIARAAGEVGPALFFSLLIITLSFIPVFTLEAQEGRLFAPLAYTKTYAMAAAAGLAVTLVPVLMGYFIRGRIPAEEANPLNRLLMRLYRPLLRVVLAAPRTTLVLAVLLLASTLWPLQRLGTEFMPELDEGDLLYMPTSLPGLSAGKAQQLLQQTDRLIASVPEVARVFGKVGPAETATDPAPMTMIETSITLKPRDQWREGLTLDQLIAELDQRVRVPGLTNAWVMPIKTRIDMLATGIRTPVGVKIAGPDLAEIQRLGEEIERVLRAIPGTRSVIAERVSGGRYLEVRPKRLEAARLGLSVADINELIAVAVGGMNLTQTVEG